MPSKRDMGWTCFGDINVVSTITLCYVWGGSSSPSQHYCLCPPDWGPGVGALQQMWPVQMGSYCSLWSQAVWQDCQNIPEMPLWVVHRPVPLLEWHFLPSVASFLGADLL